MVGGGGEDDLATGRLDRRVGGWDSSAAPGELALIATELGLGRDLHIFMH